jgi:hypothetical protein
MSLSAATVSNPDHYEGFVVGTRRNQRRLAGVELTCP